MTEYFKNYLDNEIETLEAAQSSASISTFQAEAFTAQALAPQSEVIVIDWGKDFSSGSAISLDPDGVTFHLSAGYYHMRIVGQITTDHGTTGILVDYSRIANHFSEANFVVLEDVPSKQIIDVFFTATGPFNFTVMVTALGGNADESLVFAGIDIVGFGPVQ